MSRFILILIGLAYLNAVPLAYAQQDSLTVDWPQRRVAADPIPEFRTVVIGGRTITYRVVDGMAVVEGDMILGPASEIEAAANAVKTGASPSEPTRQAAVYVNSLGTPRLWTDATAYYSIDPAVPNQQRIQTAVDHWNTVTPLKILPAAAGQANYIRFTRSSSGDCSAIVGMAGGAQVINIGDSCSSGNMIHEIGHAFGLLHEQSRIDRNAFVTVQYEYIDKGYWVQYDQGATVRDDEYYDYSSIMHYPNYGFTLGEQAEIDTVPLGIPIGERTSLSSGDIDGVSRLYGFPPSTTTITTSPQGLQIIVDGQTFTAPHAFNWGAGSTHTLNVLTRQSASPRYSFVRWTDGGDSSHTFTASADHTVVAAEFQREYQAVVSVGLGSGGGKVSIYPPSSDGYYPSGTTVRVTAKADPGSQFMGWTGSGISFNGYGPAAESADLELRGTMSLKASFSTAPLSTVTSNPVGQLVVVDGVPVLTPARFQWTAGSPHTLDLTATQYNYSSTAKYRFGGWEDGTVTTSRIVFAANASTTYLASFSTQYYLYLSSSFNGTVTTDAGGGQYIDAGTTLQVSAIPNAKQTLQYWLGDLRGDELQKPLLMDQPRSVRAVFGAALPFRPGNAGTYAQNPVFTQSGLNIAPLEIIALFGTNVGPDQPQFGHDGGDGSFASLIGNTRIYFDGDPAPILYTAGPQSNIVVPASVGGKTQVNVSVERNGSVVWSQYVSVVPTFPGLITSDSSGIGLVAAFNQNGTVNSNTQPASPDSVVTLFATGAGLMDRVLVDGQVMGADLARPLAPVYVRIGKVPARVEYGGSAPYLINGALQVNVRIPATLVGGEMPIQLIVGEYASPPGTTIAIAQPQ